MKNFFNPNTAPRTLYPAILSLLIRGRDVAIWNIDISRNVEKYMRRDTLLAILEMYGDRFSLCFSEHYLAEHFDTRSKYSQDLESRLDHATLRTSQEFEEVRDIAVECWKALAGKRYLLERRLKDILTDMYAEPTGACDPVLHQWSIDAESKYAGSIECALFAANIQDMNMVIRSGSNLPNIKPSRQAGYDLSAQIFANWVSGDGGSASKPPEEKARMPFSRAAHEMFENWASENFEEIRFMDAKHSEYLNLCKRFNAISPTELKKAIESLSDFSRRFRMVEDYAHRSAKLSAAPISYSVENASTALLKKMEDRRIKTTSYVKDGGMGASALLMAYGFYRCLQDYNTLDQFVVDAGNTFFLFMGLSLAFATYRSDASGGIINRVLSCDSEESRLEPILFSHKDFWEDFRGEPWNK